MSFSSLLVAAFALQAPQTKPETPPPPVNITEIKIVPYNPSVRREPFKALGDTRKVGDLDIIDDLAVKGYMHKDGKSYALVADSGGRIGEVMVGKQYKDGVIMAIDSKGVTFHQWDPSSPNRKIFKVVVKTYKREESTR